MNNTSIKKIPNRMCVVCKNMMPKKELIRIVKDNEGNVNIDLTGKLNGRGAYICRKDECINLAVKKKQLNRAFKCEISQEVYDNLLKQWEEMN